MDKNKKISKKEIIHLAKLAKLKLSNEEINCFQKQLSEILDYFNLLKKIDTQKTKPTSQITGLENVLCEDQTETSLSQTEALSASKSLHNDYFKVKNIFE